MRICCTRKTTPGLRALEKYAVRCGGGFNHRFGLDDAILIKDNHIAVAGGIRPVLERARAHAGHLVKIEIEVDTLAQLREVLDTGLADAVLLDNMDIATLREAVQAQRGTPRAGGIRRRHAELDRSHRGDRRRLRLSRRADPFGAEFRLRAGYRGVRSASPSPALAGTGQQSSAARSHPSRRSSWLPGRARRRARRSRAGVPQLGSSLPSPQARGR